MPLVRLTQAVVDRAVTAGAAAELGDDRRNGLVLRVNAGGKAVWQFRRNVGGRDYRRDIGGPWTLEQARDLVAALALDLKRIGPHVVADEPAFAAWLAAYRGRSVVDEEVVPPAGAKSFAQAADAWLEEVARTRKPKTALSYGGDLRVAEVLPLHDRVASTVTPQEVARIVSAIARRGAERQAQATAGSIRRLYDWLGALSRREDYGVVPGHLAGVEAPERTRDGAVRTLRVPTGPDVGRLVRALGEYDAPLRDRLAAQLLVHTAQRREPVVSARREDFTESAGVPVWVIQPSHRKTAEDAARRGIPAGVHVIPLPPRAWAYVQLALDEAGDSEWLFPATRSRRDGLEATHLHADTITHLFRDLGVGFTPHDVRRSFATAFADAHEIAQDDLKRILDHSGVGVTRRHYSFVAEVRKKLPTITAWCSWIEKWAMMID